MINYEKYLTDSPAAEIISRQIDETGHTELRAAIAAIARVPGVTRKMLADLEDAFGFRWAVIETSAFAVGWECCKHPEKLIFRDWQGEA